MTFRTQPRVDLIEDEKYFTYEGGVLENTGGVVGRRGGVDVCAGA